MKYFKLWLQLVRFSLIEVATYRVDFLFRLFSMTLIMGIMYVVLSLPYKYVGSIAGWSRNDAMVLLGIYYLSNGLSWMLFRTGIGSLELMVKKGTFDGTLLKPVDSMFLTSFFKLDMSRFGDFCVSLVFISSFITGSELDVLRVLAAVFSIVCGLVVVSRVFLMVNTLCFWTTETYLDHVANPLLVVTKYPIDIWGEKFKMLLYWVIPMAFVSSIPAGVLLGKISLVWVLAGAALAVLWSLLARMFWNFALKSYSSVGSQI